MALQQHTFSSKAIANTAQEVNFITKCVCLSKNSFCSGSPPYEYCCLSTNSSHSSCCFDLDLEQLQLHVSCVQKDETFCNFVPCVVIWDYFTKRPFLQIPACIRLSFCLYGFYCRRELSGDGVTSQLVGPLFRKREKTLTTINIHIWTLINWTIAPARLWLLYLCAHV